MVQEHVNRNGPLVPIETFKHAAQVLYCKTKGGVDKATFDVNKIRYPKSKLGFEAKYVTHLLYQACGLNACIAYRYWTYQKELSDQNRSLPSLKSVRRELSSMEAFEDFVIEAGQEIVRRGDDLGALLSGKGVEEQRPNLSEQAVADLQAKIPKGRVLRFFSTDDGWLLRSSGTHRMERITRDPLTDMPLTRSVRRCALCVRETSNYCHVCRQFLCNVAPKDGTHRACSTDFHFLRELPSTKRKDIVKRAYRMKPGEREERSRRASQLAASKKAVANDSASVDTASPANELQVEQLVKRRRGRPRKRPRPGTSDEIAVAPDSGGVPAGAQSRNRIDAPADSAPATTSSGHLAGTPARAERPEAVANLEDSRVHKRQCLEASDDVPSTPGGNQAGAHYATDVSRRRPTTRSATRGGYN
ncbi:unnamed protein product (mitochondrion) [Plasmodiophora brassicae]|uniref:Uncharacterized protein n=1 Tax=Plasmodiophora brassicae TaxID=37360 RepID=A0A3P3Y594_PLABS|nr:unnamed protein product [Plasmodiophora brassicae]